MRERLENNQVWLYAAMLAAAAALGLLRPDAGTSLTAVIPAALALLMFGMFTQIPFMRLKEALANRRFLYALLLANYVAVPLIVWGLTRLLPPEPALLLGVCLVLLAPCVDYVIVFAQLGGGDGRLVLVSTPLLLVSQMALLPVYLTLFIGKQAAGMISFGPFAEAFALYIAVPLAAALLVQSLARRHKRGAQALAAAAWLPVPLMALTLFAVVASHIALLYDSYAFISRAVPVFAAFMVIAPLAARAVSDVFRLDAGAGRALIFSASTRNSLVVLPFAFALPEPGGTLVAAVIVTQTIVELAGELVYIRLVPGVLLRSKRA